MNSYQEIMEFVEEENVQFIRLIFFDVFGRQKNKAITPGELRRVLTHGTSFNGWAIEGYGEDDLRLMPDCADISLVPWRPIDGRVAKMFCDVTYPDGRPYEKSPRNILKQAVRAARETGISVSFEPEMEFYVFQLDESGNRTYEPIDHAGYMDVDPLDRGDNVRRDICFALQEMNITPESSHHERGPGQNEVDFRYSDALTTADNTATFKWVVRSIADGSGNWADFSPKPLRGQPGNGMHINMTVSCADGQDRTRAFMAGILRYLNDMMIVLNPVPASYERFGHEMAPEFIGWSEHSRAQMVRMPRVNPPRIELRSPDPMANPYLAYALLLYAGMEGIAQQMDPGAPVEVMQPGSDALRPPHDWAMAVKIAAGSDFLRRYLPEDLMNTLLRGQEGNASV